MPIVPIVAIEIPAEVAPDLASKTLRTCNLALGTGRCAFSSSVPPPSDVQWFARIGTDPLQPNLLHIELSNALPRPASATYIRQLNFEDGDAPAHRWATVGVVVAALVISAESRASGESRRSGGSAEAADPRDASSGGAGAASVATPPKTKTEAALTQPGLSGATPGATSPPEAKTAADLPDQSAIAAPNRTTAASEEAHRAIRLDLAAAIGPGITGHHARYGINLRPSIQLTSNLTLWGQFGGTHADDTITVAWWSSALGLGLVTPIVTERLALEFRIGATGGRLEIKATDAVGNSDSAARWRFGTGAGLDVVLALTGHWGLFAGADGVYANPLVKIRQAGADVGQSLTTEVLVFGGLRWRIPLER